MTKEIVPTKIPVSDFNQSIEFQMFSDRFEEAARKDFNPYFVCHDSVVKDVSIVANKQVLNFCSYNYLGMSGRKEISDAAKNAIDLYGTSASGSRILAGEKTLYQLLEKEIADWKHTEDSIVLAAGNLTNTTFIGNFCNENDAIFYDLLSHSSTEQGCRLSKAFSKRFPHNNFKSLEKLLIRHRGNFEKVLIVVEGVYSMDGDIAPIPEFVKLKKKYGVMLMVDEAHSSGVLGENGGGVDEYFKLQPLDVDIKMGTLSKAIGSIGGYIAGSKNLITYLKYNLPGFIFAAGLSPASAAAALEAIRLIQKEPSIVQNLQKNIKLFIHEAQKRGFNTCLAEESAIIPILIGKDEDAFILSKLMLENGIFVPPAAYPAVPKNQARLRFNVISEHKSGQILSALDTLEKCMSQLKSEK